MAANRAGLTQALALIFKALLTILLLITSTSVLAQGKNDRVIGFTTQDTNGLFVLSVISSKRSTQMGLMQFTKENPGSSEMLRYPKERFEELWLSAKALDLKQFAATGDRDADLGPAQNYVITFGTGSDAIEQTFLVPKCSAPAAIKSFVDRLTEGFLPAGSPGLMRPCPVTAETPG